MASTLGTQVKKFTKWLIVRKELRYKQELDLLDKTSDDYNAMLIQLSKQNGDWMDKIHARHQVIMIGVMIISIIGAVSALIMTVFGML